MRDNGVLAIRFYDSEDNGIARAWVAPVEDFNIVFNGYGFQDATHSIASVLSRFLEKPYRKIRLSNHKSDSGLIYINSGRGYVIGDYKYESYDFYWRMPFVCFDCEDDLPNHDYMGLDGNAYCQDCFYNTYEYCGHCGDTIYRDYAVYIDEDPYFVCDDCCNRLYTRCSQCNEYVLTRFIRTTKGVIHCDNCLP